MFAAGNDRKVYKIRRRTKEKISSVTLIKSALPKNFTMIALQSTSDKTEQLIGDSQFCVSPVF